MKKQLSKDEVRLAKLKEKSKQLHAAFNVAERNCQRLDALAEKAQTVAENADYRAGDIEEKADDVDEQIDNLEKKIADAKRNVNKVSATKAAKALQKKLTGRLIADRGVTLDADAVVILKWAVNELLSR